jgi:hypothetical protein
MYSIAKNRGASPHPMGRFSPADNTESSKCRPYTGGMNLAVYQSPYTLPRGQFDEQRIGVKLNGGMKMKRFRISPITVGVLAAAFNLAVVPAPGHAWSWGSDDQQNYQFNPEHRAEIVEYGAHVGANWSEEIKESALASQDGKMDQEHIYDVTNSPNDRPGVED